MSLFQNIVNKKKEKLHDSKNNLKEEIVIKKEEIEEVIDCQEEMEVEKDKIIIRIKD